MKKIFFFVLFSVFSLHGGGGGKEKTFEDQPSTFESLKDTAHEAKRVIQKKAKSIARNVAEASTSFADRAKRGFKMTESEFSETKTFTTSIKTLSENIKGEAKAIDAQLELFQGAIQESDFTKAAQIQTKLIASWGVIGELIQISGRLEFLLKNISTVLPPEQSKELATMGDNLQSLAGQTETLVQQSSTALSELQNSLQTCGTSMWGASARSASKERVSVAQEDPESAVGAVQDSQKKSTSELGRLVKGVKMSTEAFDEAQKLNRTIKDLGRKIEEVLKKNESNIEKFKDAIQRKEFTEAAQLSGEDLGSWNHIESFIKIIGRIGALIGQISSIFPQEQQDVLQDLSAILKELKQGAEELVSKSYAILNGTQRSLSVCSDTMQRLSVSGEALKVTPKVPKYKKLSPTKEEPKAKEQ